MTEKAFLISSIAESISEISAPCDTLEIQSITALDLEMQSTVGKQIEITSNIDLE